MTDMREALKRLFKQHHLGSCYPDAMEHEQDEFADAALSLMQPEIDRRVAEERANLESKFRCVVSHATSGGFQDIDASLNEISVRISQFRTRLWEQAKQSGAKEERAKLLERLREPSEGMVAAAEAREDEQAGGPISHEDCWQAMLAKFEKELP